MGFNFKPLPGLSSNHLQTILSALIPPGFSPPSSCCFIELEDGDRLSCHVSTPDGWQKKHQTVVLVHGMGGSHTSGYMIRMARKIYLQNAKVVRVNLRGAGSGQGLAKRPYHGGTSRDVLRVLEVLRKESPESKITVIGFSLGGNVILKLAGELGESALDIVSLFIAVCPPLDLMDAVHRIEERRNRLYHAYYMAKIRRQARLWGDFRNVRSLSEFDNVLTAPLWGFVNAEEYYYRCSSFRFLPSIRQTTYLLFAEDDPFISWQKLEELTLPPHIHVCRAKQGGHMGFLGSSFRKRALHGMDSILLNWLSFFSEGEDDDTGSNENSDDASCLKVSCHLCIFISLLLASGDFFVRRIEEGGITDFF